MGEGIKLEENFLSFFARLMAKNLKPTIEI
jgi:hypothetical protein